ENLWSGPGAGEARYLVRELLAPLLAEDHHFRDDVVAKRDQTMGDVVGGFLREVLRPPDLVQRLEGQVGGPKGALEVGDREPDLGLVETAHARRDHRAGHVRAQ